MDYSKWDKFAAEMSDSEEDESHGPTVTKLDQPSRVTIGKDHSLTVTPSTSTSTSTSTSSSSASSSTSSKPTSSKSKPASSSIPPKKASTSTHPSSTSSSSSTKTSNASTSSTSTSTNTSNTNNGTYTLNGSMCSWYMWSQTATECILRFKIPDNVRAADVKITLVHPDQKSKQNSHGKLSITLVSKNKSSNQTIVDQDLAYDARATPKKEQIEDESKEEAAEDLDWEIERNVPIFGQAIRLTLHKRVPVDGVVLWWSKVFQSNEECTVDVESLPGRKDKAARKAHQDVWEQAHKAFLEKVKKIEKTEVED